MPTIQCPKCNRQNTLDATAYWTYSGGYNCIFCGTNMEIVLKGGELQGTPNIRQYVNIVGAPTEIDNDFLEAQVCYHSSAYKATVVMCRRALEIMAVKKGAEGRTLFNKIENFIPR